MENNKTIAMIPADNDGNFLFLKDLRQESGKIYLKYRSTFNDVPFFETEIHAVDNGANYAITGDDGTVLYRFSSGWLKKIK